MTGMSARQHGDRTFQPALPMPQVKTLATCLREGGYQSTAIGKLHVYPKRDRIGFDDAIIAEEGRGHLGSDDDYEIFLADQGHAGQQFLHGMGNNEYLWRPWHLPEHLHVTNWTTFTAARAIKRRDPTRPGFWYVSYTHPHPPLVPLQSYVDRYADATIPEPLRSAWADASSVPFAVSATRQQWDELRASELLAARRAAFALSTHIDHQLRVLIGTLREEQLLDNCVILFCSDHGDMLGDFGLFGKRLMYEGSTNIPMILLEPAAMAPRETGRLSNRLVALQDVMPTLLELAGLNVPTYCDGLSMVGAREREVLYGESSVDAKATRMIRDSRFKLIWYPYGNVVQLFDLERDPDECINLSQDGNSAETRDRLVKHLIDHLYGEDLAWTDQGRLVGVGGPMVLGRRTRGLGGQRGLHYPSIPLTDPSVKVGASSE